MESFNFTPFPVLTTDRLELRMLQKGDDQAIFEMRSDPENDRYINRPKTKDISDSRDFIKMISKGIEENKWLYWTITLKESGKVIGTICLWHFSESPLKAETGYELHHDFKGQGYMQEALQEVIKFSFRYLRLTAIEACTHQKNVASIRLLERNNFTFIKPMDSQLSLYVLENKL